MDIYAELVTHLSKLDAVASVHVELPHNAELRKLPCIDLQSAGPAARHSAFHGLGFDTQDIDVDLYVDEAMWKLGRSVHLANTVRAHLATFRVGQMVAVDVSAPGKRPDRNSTIRRIGMTVSVRLPAITF